MYYLNFFPANEKFLANLNIVLVAQFYILFKQLREGFHYDLTEIILIIFKLALKFFNCILIALELVLILIVPTASWFIISHTHGEVFLIFLTHLIS